MSKRTKETKTHERNGYAHPEEPEEAVPLRDTLGADLPTEKLRWLWPARIPWGQVVVFQGAKGAGKSSWMRRIAAYVTGGALLPGVRGKKKAQGNVLWYAGEEPLRSWVRPACAAAKVNMNKIRFADLSSPEAQERLALPSDCDRLSQRIEATKSTLVVLDPVLSFSDGTLDIESGSIQPRQFMLELQRVCDRTGCTILAARNLTKDTSRGALAAGRGSGELANFARAILHCQQLPGELERYGLACAAVNLGPPCATITYRITAEKGFAVIEVDGTTDTTADDLAKGEDGELERYAIARAKELIRQMLPSGKLASNVIKARAEAAMISARTLQQAAKQLGVVYSRTGRRDTTVVFWSPPKKGFTPP